MHDASRATTHVDGQLVSVSYAGALAVVGVAPPGTVAFGIDAEPNTDATRHAAAEALGRDVATCEIRDWTTLEAAAKARGFGLRGKWAQRTPESLNVLDLELPSEPTSTIVSVAMTALATAAGAGAESHRAMPARDQ
ncbi:MAG: hypothetical protein ACTH31_04715, partial [Pseudoclavibacter sp.]